MPWDPDTDRAPATPRPPSPASQQADNERRLRAAERRLSVGASVESDTANDRYWSDSTSGDGSPSLLHTFTIPTSARGTLLMRGINPVVDTTGRDPLTDGPLRVEIAATVSGSGPHASVLDDRSQAIYPANTTGAAVLALRPGFSSKSVGCGLHAFDDVRNYQVSGTITVESTS